jgi:hypothetical protein
MHATERAHILLWDSIGWWNLEYYSWPTPNDVQPTEAANGISDVSISGNSLVITTKSGSVFTRTLPTGGAFPGWTRGSLMVNSGVCICPNRQWARPRISLLNPHPHPTPPCTYTHIPLTNTYTHTTDTIQKLEVVGADLLAITTDKGYFTTTIPVGACKSARLWVLYVRG